jgi:phage-related minor tail protein
MAYDIGPRIGIEGESEFRNAIKQINENMKTLGTEMKVVASQFDKNDNSTEALTARSEVLNKQIDEQNNKLSELRKGLEAAAEKYGENDRVTQGWQRAVNQATADLNNFKHELDNTNSEMEKAKNPTRI